MRWAFALLSFVGAAGQVSAADAVAAAIRANADYQQVDRSPRPTAGDSQACVKSHEALAGLTKPEEVYLVHYRTGYCALFWAVATGEPVLYDRAAQEFTQAVATFPKAKGTPPPAIRILQIVARIEQGRTAGSFPDTQSQLRSLVVETTCTSSPVMQSSFCLQLIDVARTWVAWLSFEKGDHPDALRTFNMHAAARLSNGAQAWQSIMEAQSALRQSPQPEAAAVLDKGTRRWIDSRDDSIPDLVVLLGPRPDLAGLFLQLANLNAAIGKHSAAIAAYDAALRERPSLSRALFLRGKSKESLGLSQSALADYALAVEVAQTHTDTSWSTGDALFRRGVVYFQTKNYKGAQSEFSNALGKPLSEVSRADLTAWRVMAAVSAGDCSSAGVLESSARASSDLFPKVEAMNRVFECRLAGAKSLEQLQTIEKQSPGTPEQTKLLRTRVANMLADQGVAAEDRGDVPAAISAYLQAVAYDPSTSKARFNLGAIYIEQKRYSLAEEQFRELTRAEKSDFEAMYWLGESILAQTPSEERRAEACGYLKSSLAISDPEKHRQFSQAHVSAKCGS
jgi:tetratricopeptide (TPR) repeat protein